MRQLDDSAGLKKTRILIVDDHPVVRDGLETMLNHEPDLYVCGQTDDAPGALKAIAELNPDIAIVDIALKSSDGIELTKIIKTRFPKVFVIVDARVKSIFSKKLL